jgi:hypothetical protein
MEPGGMTRGEKAAIAIVFVLLATPVLYFWAFLVGKLLKTMGVM